MDRRGKFLHLMTITGRLGKINKFLEQLGKNGKILETQIVMFTQKIITELIEYFSQSMSEQELDDCIAFFESDSGKKLLELESKSWLTTLLSIRKLFSKTEMPRQNELRH